MTMMVDQKLSIDDRENLICYIDDHIDEMSFNDKRDILSMLKMNIADNKKFKHKGTGTQIAYKDVSNDLIIWIYNKIHSKMIFN
jgi:hypothetical protein